MMKKCNTIEQDLANLEQANKYDDLGKKAYQEKDYRNAIHHYHRCILYAKAIVQLTSTDLREMARTQMQLKMGTEQGEGKREQQIEKQESEDAETGTSSASRNRLDSTTQAQEIKEKAQELMSKSYNNLVACLLARDSNSNGKEDYMRAVSYCDNVLKEDPNNEKALFRKGVALMRADKWEKAVEQFEQCKNNAQAKQHILECKRIIDEDRRRRDAEIRANFAKARAAEEAREAQQIAAANGHPPAAGNPNPPTMNGHVQHQ